MHSITLNINNDGLFDKIFSFLQRFKDDGIEIISKKNFKNTKIKESTNQFIRQPKNIKEIESCPKVSSDEDWKKDFLSITQWDISEDDVRMKSWSIPEF